MMKRGLWMVAIIAVGCGLVAPADAQVRLKVTKNSNKDRRTTYQDRYGSYREQQVNETVSYTIEVVSMSSKPLKDVRVQWAILVANRGYSGSEAPPPLTEGEKTADLDPGKKFTFDTTTIQLSGRQTDSSTYSDGSRRTKSGSEIEGYAVEVFVAGALVTKEILPIDTKTKVDALKARQRRGQ